MSSHPPMLSRLPRTMNRERLRSPCPARPNLPLQVNAVGLQRAGVCVSGVGGLPPGSSHQSWPRSRGLHGRAGLCCLRDPSLEEAIGWVRRQLRRARSLPIASPLQIVRLKSGAPAFLTLSGLRKQVSCAPPRPPRYTVPMVRRQEASKRALFYRAESLDWRVL